MSIDSRLAKRVATDMWEADGKPERDPNEPTSVGRDWYEARAREVLFALARLGYVVKSGGAKQ